MELRADGDVNETESLRAGMRLGRYELLLPIAKGGMARVWAARLQGQRGFSKTVAIKTILPHLAEENEFEKMFLDEARIASGVHHPNVCEIYELGEEGKVLYLAMEWISGESLMYILRSGPVVTPPQGRPTKTIEAIHPHLAARIISDAAAGLHAAHNLTDDDGHSLNVVHRDVSPHNILISDSGTVKVTDFGVAKALGQTTSTMAGQVKGKMAYMAPEQMEGGKVDRRSDVFSLGIVLYEATTGTKPFAGEGDVQLMHAILSGEFVSPSQLVRGYPRELEQIVMRALARKPGDRFSTAERMHVALEEFIAKSGSIVTQSHVASLVQQRAGAHLERRREKIRAAANAPNPDDISGSGANIVLPTTTPSLLGSASGVQAAQRGNPSFTPGMPSGSFGGGGYSGGPAPLVVGSDAPPSPMKYVLAAGAGVGVACILALVGLFIVNKAHQNEPGITPVMTIASVTKPTAPASASLNKTTLTFNVLPTTAFLIVDGNRLEAEARTVQRPPVGVKRSVTIQAPGYVDQVLLVDQATPSAMDVTLSPIAAPVHSASANPERKNGTRPPSLPANPYGP